MARDVRLSPRMVEHLKAAADGLTVPETARRLCVSEESVKSARRRYIMRELGARNMVQAVHIAHERGLL